MSIYNIVQQEAADTLTSMLENHDWFSFSAPEKNYINVYVHYMNDEVIKIVPYKFNDFNVKLVFQAFLDCEEKYSKVVELV